MVVAWAVVVVWLCIADYLYLRLSKKMQALRVELDFKQQAVEDAVKRGKQAREDLRKAELRNKLLEYRIARLLREGRVSCE